MKLKMFLNYFVFCLVGNSFFAVLQEGESQNEEKAMRAQVCMSQDEYIRQWVASQIVYNKIRVLEQQIHASLDPKDKKEMPDQKS